jgi:uncharacterized protein (TIGR02284 family)
MYSTKTLDPDIMDKVGALVRLHVCIAEGFRSAADQLVCDPVRAERLRIRAAARDSFVREMRSVLSRGAPIPNSGPLGDALHRWWTRLQDMAEAVRQYLVESELERGADQIRAHFEEALEESLDEPMGEPLLRQMQNVNRIRDFIGHSADTWH